MMRTSIIVALPYHQYFTIEVTGYVLLLNHALSAPKFGNIQQVGARSHQEDGIGPYIQSFSRPYKTSSTVVGSIHARSGNTIP